MASIASTRLVVGMEIHIELATDSGVISWGGNRFRELVGWSRVRSTRFTLEGEGEQFLLAGLGYGVEEIRDVLADLPDGDDSGELLRSALSRLSVPR